MRQIVKNLEPAHFMKWKSDFKAANNRDATYDDLTHTSEYFRLKRSLLEEQGYICCYCERRIGQRSDLQDCDIEHFMPRHPDRRVLSATECVLCENAQLIYLNLYASCKGEFADCADHCNHKKDNWFDFAVCIPPCDDRMKDAFGFRINGKIFAKNHAAEKMKEHLNLTSYVLEEQRKMAFQAVMEVEFDDVDLIEDKEYIESVIEDYDVMQDGKYAEFCSMITYCLQEYYL